MTDTSKVWFITGSSRGFGAELVRAVLANGDRVVATARQPEQLRALVEGHEDRARIFELDATDSDAAVGRQSNSRSPSSVASTGREQRRRRQQRRVRGDGAPDFRGQIEANLFGVVNVTRAALPVLRAQRSGVFVQFSSIGGRVGGTPGLSAYQAAKFGVEGFSEVVANEVRAFGVRVIIIEPGAFRTDWMGSSMTMHEPGPDYRDALALMHELRRTSNGSQSGDPARAARIIIDVVESPDPPRRLLLGSDAVELALASGTERDEEARRWAAVSRSADFPE